MSAELVFNYFPDLNTEQKDKIRLLETLYSDWNQKINLVSRKDIDELYLRHVLHSLGIAKVISFVPGTTILDVGTGGGFPGIPLAILFPEVQFTLVDSVGKKIRVVSEVVRSLDLSNVRVLQTRVEEMTEQFDFVISRAVAAMPTFVRWTAGRIRKKSKNALNNGILYLKGGDLSAELADLKSAQIFDLRQFFAEDFFQTKKVVYLPIEP